MVDLSKIDMFLAIEPNANFGRAHIQVQFQLGHAVLAGLFLALDDDKQILFELSSAPENRNVHRVRPLLVGRALPHPELGVGLNLRPLVPVVLHKAPGEDLDSLLLFRRRPNLGAADVVIDVARLLFQPGRCGG